MLSKIASPRQLLAELRQIQDYINSSAKPQRAVIAADLRDLANRIAGGDKKPLYGHDDMNSAYQVDDYPYSFKLRCKIRYWLEFSPSKGFRFVSQTENPKTMRWNAPKKSTYNLLGGCMYLDEKDHVQWDGVTEYSDGAKVLEFVKNFPKSNFTNLKVYVAKKIRFLQLSAEGKVVWTMNGVAQPVTEEDMGRSRAELETWQEVEKKI
jgi:hypothetical protein